jgi:hypothetical protein
MPANKQPLLGWATSIDEPEPTSDALAFPSEQQRSLLAPTDCQQESAVEMIEKQQRVGGAGKSTADV